MLLRFAAGLAAGPLLVACSSGDDPGAAGSSASPPGSSAPSSEPSAGPSSGPSSAVPGLPSWNPCDDLRPGEVSRLLGEEVTEDAGSAGAPRCTFVPVAEGGATLDVNYLFFDGSFDEAWSTIGSQVAGEVRDVDVPGADAARLVEQVTEDAVLVTGFVQTDGLIESVNAIALDPADRDRLVRAARGVLALLSARAPVD